MGERLQRAYPEHVQGVDGNDVVFRDGARLPLDDGKAEKPFEDWLAAPDIKDMFRYDYPKGAAIAAPPPNADPGRARNAAFFTKIYGDCSTDAFSKSLVDVPWLPSHSQQVLKVTRINGAAERLRAVSTELDKLTEEMHAYLIPSAGTVNCRPIAGTNTLSAHGYGIAIDIAVARSNYWRWQMKDASSPGTLPAFTNQIPKAIVDIFERHGFVWGGRWSHFDTMHFEYRPELVPPEAPSRAP